MKTLRFFILAAIFAGLVVSAQAQDVVSDLLGRINGLRASLGLPAYTLNGALSAAALNQAQWMATTGQISHTQSDGSTPSSRAAAAGYGGSWVSENIYAGTNAGVGDAWTFWLNSPIHYRGMTNTNYQEIGIASASSSWGRAYVLVFGRIGGAAIAAPARPNSGSGAAAAPPSFVVGLDNFGNIMHEVQPEQTIGDILLTYGYTWDDLPEFLTLNNKTDADIRRLQIGEIVLVPPYGGTYTPTPLPEGWPTSTPEPEDFIATAIAEAAAEATATAQTLTPAPTATERPRLRRTQRALTNIAATPQDESTAVPDGSSERVATSVVVPMLLVSTFTPSPTVTPPGVSPTPAAGINLMPSFTPVITLIASIGSDGSAPSAPLQDVIVVTPQGDSPWLIVALIVQAVIIVGAGIVLLRGVRRR